MTYTETEQSSSLKRIKALLDQMQSSAAAKGREWKEPFIPNPCISKMQLAKWEAKHNVVLPDEYRQFLLEIGDGGRMHGDYCDFVVYPLADISIESEFSSEFPISKQLLKTRLNESNNDSEKKQEFLFYELEAYWEDGIFPGCLHFGMYPGGDGVFMVVKGELQGTIWCAISGGLPDKSPHNFLSWFEDVLLEAKT